MEIPIHMLFSYVSTTRAFLSKPNDDSVADTTIKQTKFFHNIIERS